MTWKSRLRLAYSFLTLVPVAAPMTTDKDVARSLGFFPVVGLSIGIVLTGIAWLLIGTLSAQLIAIIIVAASAIVTGGLHWDGVTDVFDGLGGSRGDPVRALEIMRDSRIGSHGALALVLLLVTKCIASGQLIDDQLFLWLAFAPMVARALLVPIVVYVPYARSQGLGWCFHTHSGSREMLLPIAALTITAVWGGIAMSCGILISATGVSLLVAILYSKMRGLTGDGYGAVLELSEVLFLLSGTI